MPRAETAFAPNAPRGPQDAAALRLTRRVKAPPALVFDCLTDSRHLARWLFAPDGWQLSWCSVDARPGGWFKLLFRDPGGARASVTGAIRRMRAPDYLAGTTQVVTRGRIGWYRFSIEFRATDDGTEIVHIVAPLALRPAAITLSSHRFSIIRSEGGWQ